MSFIAAANRTIRFFNQTNTSLSEAHISQIYDTVSASDIEERLVGKLKRYVSKDEVVEKFNYYKNLISNSPQQVHQFASAKKYFSSQFNVRVNQACNASVQINNHKALLATIMAANTPTEFSALLSFLCGDRSFNDTESLITS